MQKQNKTTVSHVMQVQRDLDMKMTQILENLSVLYKEQRDFASDSKPQTTERDGVNSSKVCMCFLRGFLLDDVQTLFWRFVCRLGEGLF